MAALDEDPEGDYQPPSLEAVLGEDPDGIMVRKAEGPPAAEVYQSIRENMNNNTLPFGGPVSVTSKI